MLQKIKEHLNEIRELISLFNFKLSKTGMISTHPVSMMIRRKTGILLLLPVGYNIVAKDQCARCLSNLQVILEAGANAISRHVITLRNIVVPALSWGRISLDTLAIKNGNVNKEQTAKF